MNFLAQSHFQILQFHQDISGTTLAVASQTALNTGHALTYTVIYDTTTFRFTISATGTFQINFAIANSIAQALGFTEITTPSTTSITSPDVAVINPDTEIFISSSLVGGIDNGIISYFTGPSSNLKILAIVPLMGCYR